MNWLKLSRSITDSQVFAHPIALKIWIWCLCKASHKQRHIQLKVGKGDRIVTIEAGQFIFGRHKAEEALSIDGSTIYKWLQKFESADFSMILIESNNQYSIITICNWEEYQHDYNKKEQPSNNLVTTEEQLSSNQVTTEEHKQDLIYLENVKKEREENSNNPLYIKTDKLLEVMKNESSWHDSIYKDHKLKPKTLSKWLNAFVLKLKSEGEEGKTVKDFKSHFSRWLKIELKKPENKIEAEQTYRPAPIKTILPKE